MEHTALEVAAQDLGLTLTWVHLDLLVYICVAAAQDPGLTCVHLDVLSNRGFQP